MVGNIRNIRKYKMFYIVYITPKGHYQAIHTSDYGNAVAVFEMLKADNPYCQLGGVGTGMIEDSFTQFETAMPKGESFEDRDINEYEAD